MVVSSTARRLRICLLSYRGNPYSGGQGIYIHYLSRELQAMGHEVHVVAGPPYPEVVEGVTVHKLESLGLYDSTDNSLKSLARINTPLRLFEFLAVSLGTFPEPLTFSIRAYHRLRALLADQPFDIIHDNQCLGYGMLLMKRLGVPVVATIHHPIHIDRSIEFAQARGWWDKFRLWRWFSFIPMQHSVATRMDRVMTVSQSAAEDIQAMFGVPKEAIRVVFNGVDVDFFGNNGHVAREPNRLIMVSSGNGHTKGLRYLLEALRQLRDETALSLTVVSNDDPEAEPARLTREFGLDDIVTLTGRIDRQELADLYSASEIAVVPSLHEGFGFPAAEAMSSRLPVISTTAGALPEVVGEDGHAGLLIPPGDSTALATALRRLLGDEALRRRMGERGRKRAVDNFSWRQAARNTVSVYEELLQHAHD